MTIVLLDKTYDGESIYDLTRDVDEAIDESMTPELKNIPKDEYGFQQGKFVVSIVWQPSNQ